jgi:purine-nucleoside phosphorylase
MTQEDLTSIAARAQECAAWLGARTGLRPRLGFVLGSGLGSFAEALEEAARFPYAEVPGFCATTIPGHAGELIVGRCEGVPVVVLSGRFHAYEGHDLAQVTFPVRALRAFGVETLVITNSAGGIDAGFEVGDLMVIEDHINFTGRNPLMGHNEDALGPRFPDMSTAYDPALRQLLHEAARGLGQRLRQGVYVSVLGPSYETPAEIRMFRALGAQAVGMSTVHEVIVASHGGVRVAGISCISNMAAGMLDAPLSHDDVKHAAALAGDNFVRLLRAFTAALAAQGPPPPGLSRPGTSPTS